MTHEELVLAALNRMNANLEALPARIAAALRADEHGPLSAADRAVVEQLLDPMLEAVGEAHFTLQELNAEAEHRPRLRAALDGLERAGTSRKALGKLLARVQGADLGGAVIWKRRDERNGALWQIQRV